MCALCIDNDADIDGSAAAEKDSSASKEEADIDSELELTWEDLQVLCSFTRADVGFVCSPI